MARQDERVDDDDDDDRPAKKKDKKETKGSNTMLFALIGGGLAVVLLCCVCGGVGGGGWYFGWFGGSSKTIAKAEKDGDKDKNKEDDKDKNKDQDKNKDLDKVKDKPGPRPTGTGPQVTADNFRKAARDGNTLTKVEQILGQGLPLKGADAANAMKYPGYKFLRGANPNGPIYQWSNNEAVYFISFFDNGAYMGQAQNPIDVFDKAGGDKKKGPKGGK